MKRLLKNKKALSPVLSTILMIVIVVIGMTIAFGFFVNYVRDFQAGRGSSVMELLDVEDVWFKPASDVEIQLYNYGKIDAKISSVYVDGLLVDFTPTEIQVLVGKHAKMTISLTSPWAPNGVSYDIKIVTERGSVFEGEYVSPVTG
jgi:flagellin-like protein